MQLPVKQRLGKQMLEIGRIRLDGGTQSRETIHERVAREYGAAMRNDGLGKLPPIIVYYDAIDLWLADGFHRLYGARLYGMANIYADVREGTQRDAILCSVGANAQHGLRRTNADKRRAVEMLLRDEECKRWSDHQIAEICCVDPKTVGNVRKAVRRDSGVEIPQVRRGRDGKLYRAPRFQCGVCNAMVEAPHQHYTCDGCGKSSLDGSAYKLIDSRWLCKECASGAAKPPKQKAARRTPQRQARRAISADQMLLPGFDRVA